MRRIKDFKEDEKIFQSKSLLDRLNMIGKDSSEYLDNTPFILNDKVIEVSLNNSMQQMQPDQLLNVEKQTSNERKNNSSEKVKMKMEPRKRSTFRKNNNPEFSREQREYP